MSSAQRQRARCYSGATTLARNRHQVGAGRGHGGGSSESAQVLGALMHRKLAPCKRAPDSLLLRLRPQHPAIMQ